VFATHLGSHDAFSVTDRRRRRGLSETLIYTELARTRLVGRLLAEVARSTETFAELANDSVS